MKKLLLVIFLVLMVTSLFAQVPTERIPVEQYTGYQWERLTAETKAQTVSSFLAGFSEWRNYLFDLDTTLYQKYQAFDKFLERSQIVEKIVKDLDRYYVINKNDYKYKDRVVSMILIFYGKYWWIEI